MRIVSLCPSNTELLGFMGLTSFIVGVDNYSDWPAQVNDLPRLGSDLDIDIAAVEALQPDLVLASLTVPGMEKNIEGLKERGLPFITLNPKSLSDIADNMLEVGKATGQEEIAQAVYSKYVGLLEQFAEFGRKVEERPRLYWEWWPKPVFTPGGTNWLTEISNMAGGHNVFADDERASVKTDWEDVRKRDPDYILMAWVGVKEKQMKPQLLKQRPDWPEMKAIKDNRVMVMEESLYCRPSPRLLLGIQKLGILLHPHLFPAYDEQKAEEWVCPSIEL
ncbi:iron complex transport system substrate-binding protein [Cytobacillus eiseniae]|uniref:Iron complex transport system substrate-binding protein n=1 Tax=Cytobacillus eiseniae TaxID=762947 RepID=A0ABS4RF76_9BACI|nr:cobalamin-binding protein [Cytobacillus eiseniae]MBP2240959.1 iron complex transport system substrate-binding protein [Cytobacillus eiseniae]